MVERVIPSLCALMLGAACAEPPQETATGGGGAGGRDAPGGHDVHSQPAPILSPEWLPPDCQAVTGTTGVTFSLDGGATLVPVLGEPPSTVAYTLDVAVSATPGVLHADVDGMVMRSGDAGCNWERLGGGWKAERLYAAEPGFLYGVSNGGGFRYSKAGFFELDVGGLQGFGVEAEDGSRVVFAREAAIMESSDGGASFTERSSSPGLEVFGFAPKDPSIVIGSAYADLEGAISLSEDMGLTWRRVLLPELGTGVLLDFAFSPVDPNVIWVLERRTADQNNILFHSDDGGETFSIVYVEHELPPYALNNGTLAPSPKDPGRVAIVGRHGVDSTISIYDRGNSTLTIHPHPATHLSRVAISPANDNILYVALSYLGQTN